MGHSEDLKSDEQFFQVVQQFIETGGDIDRKDAQGHTLLLMAANKVNVDAVRFLLSKGANAEVREHLGWSAAHFAALKNNIEIMQLVLDAGCPVDGLNMANETPLLLAAMYCHDKIIELLLKKYDAKANVVDWKGSSPLQVVRDGGASSQGDRERALALLSEYSALQKPERILEKEEGARKFEQHDYLGAAQEYTNALKLDGTDADTHLQRSICMSKLGLPNDAACDAIRALGLDPTLKQAHRLCIESHMQMKNYKEALKAADFAMQHCADDDGLRQLRHEVQQELSRPQPEASSEA